MKYSDGQEVRVGDRVGLGGGLFGRVVAVMDTGEYSEHYSAEEWSYLGTGALVLSKDAGLIHCPSAEGDLCLIGRK